jgi:hypothetical protein
LHLVANEIGLLSRNADFQSVEWNSIPEGCLTTAQRFKVGIHGQKDTSPEGTADHFALAFSRPFGTRGSKSTLPNVETLGYCRLSLVRDKLQSRTLPIAPSSSRQFAPIRGNSRQMSVKNLKCSRRSSCPGLPAEAVLAKAGGEGEPSPLALNLNLNLNLNLLLLGGLRQRGGVRASHFSTAPRLSFYCYSRLIVIN